MTAMRKIAASVAALFIGVGALFLMAGTASAGGPWNGPTPTQIADGGPWNSPTPTLTTNGGPWN